VILAGCNRSPDISSNGSNTSEPPKTTPDSPANVSVVFTPETRNLVSPEEVPLLEQIDRENTRVVNAAMPSIVRITATRPVDPHLRFFGNEIPFQLPFGPNQRKAPPPNDTAFGSGVIISQNGYILTNDHVIEDSNQLEVQLDDKRTFGARLVASDELVDVAILKIDASGLPALPWGDSDKVEIGQQVFAIGNPFDLDDSVSKGIVSAKGRNLPQSRSYQDYIQTDAAINPGNSGGALINIRGELIGINAAIASTSRVNMGIGFAIPSNLVRYAVDGLLKDGHLVRGYLGVILPDSVDDGVIAQLNLKSSQGAFLADVQADSPAAKARLQAWDFITAVDGHRVDSEADLRLIVAQLPIGKEVQIDFTRNGKPHSTQVRITELQGDEEVASNPGENPGNGDQFASDAKEPAPTGTVLDGLQVVDLTDKVRQKFGLDPQRVTSGVVVNNVQEGSPADEKGIQRGDVIQSASISRGATREVTTAKDFTSLTSELKPDQGVALLVNNSENHSNFVYLAPPPK
jgi:serine protease Do